MGCFQLINCGMNMGRSAPFWRMTSCDSGFLSCIARIVLSSHPGYKNVLKVSVLCERIPRRIWRMVYNLALEEKVLICTC